MRDAPAQAVARGRDYGDRDGPRASGRLLPGHHRRRPDLCRSSRVSGWCRERPGWLSSRRGKSRARIWRASTARPRPGRPRTAVQAVRAADLVVASGGGYLTDTWWWHASGVLSLLSLAQRLGKPTAMFGQGIGPMERRLLRAQSRAVLPRLTLLGLREDRTGRPLASSLGVAPTALALTGDDALEQGSHPGALASRRTGRRHAAGHVLGVNLRVSGYAGVDQVTAASVASVVRAVAAELRADLVGLPVSRYATAADAGALRELWPGQSRRALPRRASHRRGLHGRWGAPGAAWPWMTSPPRRISSRRWRNAVPSSPAATMPPCSAWPPACPRSASPSRPTTTPSSGGWRRCSPVPAAPSHSAARRPPPAWRRRSGKPGSCRPAARAAAAATAAALRDAGRQAYAQFRLAVESHENPAERPVMLR